MIPASSSATRRLGGPEWSLLALGSVAALALLGTAGWGRALWATGLGLLLYAGALWMSQPASAARLLFNYLFVMFFYEGSSWLVPALRRPVQNDTLLAWDRWLLGETPSVKLEAMSSWWLTEAMSAAYLGYLVYLHWVILHALFQSDRFRARLSGLLFPAFALGYALYLIVPAQIPGRAFATLYSDDLPGGQMTELNQWLSARTAAEFDVFPSLHVLITLLLLAFDWTECRRRFYFMLGPSVLSMASTVYLRFHYAVDVFAAVLLFALIVAGLKFTKNREGYVPA